MIGYQIWDGVEPSLELLCFFPLFCFWYCHFFGWPLFSGCWFLISWVLLQFAGTSGDLFMMFGFTRHSFEVLVSMRFAFQVMFFNWALLKDNLKKNYLCFFPGFLSNSLFECGALPCRFERVRFCLWFSRQHAVCMFRFFSGSNLLGVIRKTYQRSPG